MSMTILGVTIKVAVEAETDVPADAEATLKTETTKIGMEIEVNTNKGIMTIEVKTRKISLEVTENSRMIMGIETIETEEMAKVVEEVKNGTITKVKVMGVEDGGIDGINIHNTHLKVIAQGPTIRTPIIIDHHPWDIKVSINSHLHNTHRIIPHNNIQIQAQSPQAAHVCQLCHNQGHYDYQCELAGDFLNRTQKAFN